MFETTDRQRIAPDVRLGTGVVIRDFVGVVDAPDNVSIAAMSLAVNASGVTSLRTTPLLTPEEMDAAAKKQVTYRGPGQ